MRQSELFTKTKREAPKDEVSKNAELLMRGGYIYKEMAGVYAYLPLGLKTFKKIEQIIREEMNAIGGQEIVLTTLQERETWEKTNRWDDEVLDVWFKTKLKNDTELGLATTHEEPLTKLMKESISSYRDLPRYVYQFQTKFRNELRAKSGIMRTREFVMKDLYSFSKTEEEFRAFYERCAQAYKNIFNRVGIGHVTYRTFASGGSFSKFSDEFQTICSAGEDTIFICDDKNIAVNKEVYTDEVLADLGVTKADFREERAIEVGNIFPLGTRFSSAFDLNYTDEDGSSKPVIMGSYGIGPGRLMGTIVEVLSDDKGIIWPESIAPYKVHLLSLGESPEVKEVSENLYSDLTLAGVEVLFDDRAGVSPGEKFADADLVGMPVRLVVSERSLKQGGCEFKKRIDTEATIMTVAEAIDILK